MAGRPAFAGAVQFTFTLERDAAVTVGAPGASGGSSTSVTLIVTSCEDEFVPSLAITVTVQFVRLSWFRSGPPCTVIAPLPLSMSKKNASEAPSSE